MKQHRMRAYWVWALAAALPAACGGNAVSDPPSPTATAGTGGQSSGGDPQASCPASYPTPHTACKVAAGIKCEYGVEGQCPYLAAVCNNGEWLDRTPADTCAGFPFGTGTGNVPAGGAGDTPAAADGGVSTPACPTNIPSNGSACPVGVKGWYECVYNPENPCITTLAHCVNGTWSLAYYDILCTDAGAGGAGGDSPIDIAGGAGGDWPIDLAGAAGEAR